VKSNIFQKTFRHLEGLAEVNDSKILIAYSGGKDSLVVLDMCSKIFEQIICFYMYIVPGISIVEQQIKYAQDRYGVEVIQYPHWILSRFLKQGIYCNADYRHDEIPDLKPNDIFALAREDSGLWLIATGQKKSDTMWRRRNLSQETPGVINPLKDWNKYEVLAYCKLHNIPLPDSAEGNVSGIDLSERTLLWLYDKHPEDFKKLLKIFPFAEVPIMRKQFYEAELNSKRPEEKRS
jgi:tRNA(Ile)-lysidine synthase TilS/MesJ